MRLLILLFLFVLASSGQTVSDPADDSPLAVLDFRWLSSRRAAGPSDAPATGPAREVIAANKNFQRNARVNNPRGADDPNDFTLDGRSAALDKINRESRTAKLEPVNGFLYVAKVKNLHTLPVEVVFWEYRFTERAKPANTATRQFLCAARIKAGEYAELEAFSTLGPSDVISAEGLSGSPDKLFDEKVRINRIEYADGSILQRKDWNYAGVKAAVERAVVTPWGGERCRGL